MRGEQGERAVKELSKLKNKTNKMLAMSHYCAALSASSHYEIKA